MADQQESTPAYLHRDTSRSIYVGLHAHFNDPRLSDITIVRPDGRQVHVHQVVLAACSRKFAAVLADGDATGKELPIQGVDSAALESVLAYFYRGECLLSPLTVVPLYDVCLKLEVPGLSAACEQYIRQSLNAHTCPVFLEAAVRLLLEQTVARCLAFARSRFEDVASSPSFQQLSAQAVRLLLTHSRGAASDLALARALARWAVQRPEHLGECEAMFQELNITTSALVQLLQSPEFSAQQSAGAAGGRDDAPAGTGGAGGGDRAGGGPAAAAAATASGGGGGGINADQSPLRPPAAAHVPLKRSASAPAADVPPMRGFPPDADPPAGAMSLPVGGLSGRAPSGAWGDGSADGPSTGPTSSGRSGGPPGALLPQRRSVQSDLSGGRMAGGGEQQGNGDDEPPLEPRRSAPGVSALAAAAAAAADAEEAAQLRSSRSPRSGSLDGDIKRPLPVGAPGRAGDALGGEGGAGEGPDGDSSSGSGIMAVPLALLEAAGLSIRLAPSGDLLATGGALGARQVALNVVPAGPGVQAPLLALLPASLLRSLQPPPSAAGHERERRHERPAAQEAEGDEDEGVREAAARGLGLRAAQPPLLQGPGLPQLGLPQGIAQGGRLPLPLPPGPNGTGPGAVPRIRGLDPEAAAMEGPLLGRLAPGGRGLLGPPSPANGGVDSLLLGPPGAMRGGGAGVLLHGQGAGRGAPGGGAPMGLMMERGALDRWAPGAGPLLAPLGGGPELYGRSPGRGLPGDVGGQRAGALPPHVPSPPAPRVAPGGRSGRAGSNRDGQGGTKPTHMCHVDNCNVDLSNLKEYHQRFRICEFHLKASVVLRDGVEQRFCQQCGRFHLLSEFDGTKRSCRARLQRHNARRRKRPDGRGGTSPGESDARKAPRPTIRRAPGHELPGLGGGLPADHWPMDDLAALRGPLAHIAPQPQDLQHELLALQLEQLQEHLRGCASEPRGAMEEGQQGFDREEGLEGQLPAWQSAASTNAAAALGARGGGGMGRAPLGGTGRRVGSGVMQIASAAEGAEAEQAARGEDGNAEREEEAQQLLLLRRVQQLQAQHQRSLALQPQAAALGGASLSGANAALGAGDIEAEETETRTQSRGGSEGGVST